LSIQSEEQVGMNAECYTNNMPQDFQSCSFVLHAWAIGGGVSSECAWII